MRRLKLIRTMVRLGPSTLFHFGLHRLRVRNGYYGKALPTAEWASSAPAWAQTGTSPFPAADLAAIRAAMPDAEAARAAGDRILAGEFLYFSRHWLPFSGWRRNPHTQFETAPRHWSRIADFNPEQGDIKWIWEASRFDWVYALARAWAATGDEKYVEHFWTLVDTWRAQNAPNCGANWKCGQESALRLIALAWAGGTFARCACSTPERLGRLWETVGSLANRVKPAIGYAVAQRNNHALSEAAGLTLAAVCLPQHPEAAAWAKTGRDVMRRQVEVQFAPDGSYAQNSNNYTRIALRDLFVFATAVEFKGETVDPVIRDRALAATDLLYRMHDPKTGRVPNYGSNDGANILSLSNAEYLDYRPLMQSLAARFDGKRWLPEGAQDEELAWHFGARKFPLQEKALASFAAEVGGYYGMRGPDSFGLIRCHTYRLPPAHADALALDLWIGGVNVCPDKGTYQYYDPRNLGEHFSSTAAHNTVEVEGQSQMIKGTRFLWLDWVQAKLHRFSPDGTFFDGEHSGYVERYGVTHRRVIHRRGDAYLIVDDLTLAQPSERQLTLRWHLKGEDWRLQGRIASSPAFGLSVSVFPSEGDEVALLQGPEHSPETEESLHYAELSPLSALKASVKTGRSFRWVTAIGPESPPLVDGEVQWEDLAVPIAPGVAAKKR
jgi:hypothetical protein